MYWYYLALHEKAQSKQSRLSVTENCSLVVKKVTVDDSGHYHCRQFNKSGQQQGPDVLVNLFVINIHEHKDDDNKVTLSCSVLGYEGCQHTVQWLYQGNKDDFTDLTSSQDSCSATVTFTTCHVDQKSEYKKSFQCRVTDKTSGKQLLFNFTPQSSCTTKENTKSTGNPTQSAHIDDPKPQQCWWRIIIVPVSLTVLIISVVGVNVWIKTKGIKTQMDHRAVHYHVDEGEVNYENAGDPSASARLHNVN
ncbi:uncharacterized protein LOC113149654 [Anabas testudineus]|uniref:uncharacterized protein LOC113149654 n=1 Tax=Anabas testudineus TaxID=64144 RepID=UPI000E46164D|nr:uncharacterized protein LOC113149654 [Anabas testudineus]